MTHRIEADRGARSRKRKALLAGGAILGIGATATLAAWSDDVWVTSAFSTGSFNVQANVVDKDDESSWKDFNGSGEDGVGMLTFSVAPEAMTPGQSVYAPLFLRVSTGHSDAEVALSEAPTGPNPGLPVPTSADTHFFSALSLSLYATSICSADGVRDMESVGSFNNLGADQLPPAPLLTLNKPNEGGPGDAEALCFKVTLNPNVGPEIAGGRTGDITWKFTATAISE